MHREISEELGVDFAARALPALVRYDSWVITSEGRPIKVSTHVGDVPMTCLYRTASRASKMPMEA